MLYDIFKEKRCFKLICGAGNEDTVEVEKLVALYSDAGCNFFDVCAKKEVIEFDMNSINTSVIDVILNIIYEKSYYPEIDEIKRSVKAPKRRIY